MAQPRDIAPELELNPVDERVLGVRRPNLMVVANPSGSPEASSTCAMLF